MLNVGGWMKIYFKDIVVKTTKMYELIDITRDVERIVSESKIVNGICVIHAPHATAAIVINEHENGLMSDILEFIRELVPRDGKWKHNIIDDNASAHIISAIIGSTRIIPVRDGRLVRGTWQNIFLLEADGPRHARRIVIEVFGE